MINPISPSTKDTLIQPIVSNKENDTSQVKQDDDSGVTLELGSKAEKPATYSKPEVSPIAQLQKEADDALAPLRRMVEDLLKSQGLTFNASKAGNSAVKLVKITPEIQAEAQKLVGDGGEFSVENTSDRIVDFAKAISGGDKSKLEALRAAIQKGYEDAKEAFGGSLPDISQKTLDMTMKKLDDWAGSAE